MDLLKIREYIAEDSPVAARREMIRFISAFRSLARRPGLGHKREDLPDPDLRVWPTGAYLVVYWRGGDRLRSSQSFTVQGILNRP